MKAGEFIGLMGGNGSGKSTLLQLLNGLLLPSQGEVTVDGLSTHDLHQRKEITRRVGLVFQNPDEQIVGSTVQEEVLFGMENLGFDRTRMKKNLALVLEMTGLVGMESRHPAFLSGGQKQKLAIASILAMEPDYILMDEPSSMLDPEGALEISQFIGQLVDHGQHTILLCSHDPEELMKCGRILYMDKGRLVIDQPPVQAFRSLEEDHAFGTTPYIRACLQWMSKKSLKIGSNLPGFLEPEDFADRILKDHS